jgi:hypothetical protein
MSSPKRRTSMIILASTVPLAALVVAAPASNASAAVAATTVVADYEMNEAPGSTVLVDGSGNGFNGHIGAAVTPNGSSHHFDLRSHTSGTPATPEHLDTVPSRPGLNPGSRNYAITLRLRWAGPLPDVNLVQKGQGASRGWKIESATGHVRCQFLGTLGQVTLKSIDFTSKTWADGNWHIVTCARIGNVASLRIDGQLIGSRTKDVGDITNTWPISIAGKTQCDNVKVWCDYWSGDMDYIRITSP